MNIDILILTIKIELFIFVIVTLKAIITIFNYILLMEAKK